MPKFAKLNLQTFLCTDPMPKRAKKCQFLAIFDFANVQQIPEPVTRAKKVGAGDSIANCFSRFVGARLTN